MPSSAAAEFESPQQAPWGLQAKGNSTTIAGWDALGWALAEVGDHIYVGGNFLEVTNGAATESQPYLARFNTNTGVFDPTFRPDLGSTVLALEPSPDGGLFVGGELGTWNGQSTAALIKIDPATGERWPGFETRIYGGSSYIEDIKVESDGWVYASGSFTTAGLNGNTVAVKNVVRFNPTTGVIDASWTPQPNSTVRGVSRSKTKSVVYIAGNFTSVNGQSNTQGFVGLDDSGSVVVNRPADTINRQLLGCGKPTYCTQMYDVEATSQGDVWITGVEHATYQMDEANYQTKSAHFTFRGPACDGLTKEERAGLTQCRSPGGDGQELYVSGDRVYALCHCFGAVYSATNANDLILSPVNWYMTPVVQNGGFVKEASGVIAFDAVTGAVETSFDPFMSGTSGGFSVIESSDNCLWVTGDFSRVGQPGVEPTAPGRDLVRLCDGGVAPDPTGAPASCSVAVDGRDATVTWAASPGAAGYRIYRSVDGGPQYWQGRVNNATSFDTTLRASGSHQYFVTAIKADGSLTAFTTCGDPVAPAEPATCAVSAVVGREVTVTWTAAPGAVGYRIYRSVDGSPQYWQGRVDNATSFDTRLRSSGSHQYYVGEVLADGGAGTLVACGGPVEPN